MFLRYWADHRRKPEDGQMISGGPYLAMASSSACTQKSGVMLVLTLVFVLQLISR